MQLRHVEAVFYTCVHHVLNCKMMQSICNPPSFTSVLHHPSVVIPFLMHFVSRDSAHSCHILSSKARNLTTQDSLPCDPFVVVECCGKRYQTDTKEAKAMFVSWNEAPTPANKLPTFLP